MASRTNRRKCTSIWKKDTHVVGEFKRNYKRLWQFQKALEDRINIFHVPYIRHNNIVLAMEAKNINHASSLTRYANIGRYFKRRIAPLLLIIMISLMVTAFIIGYQELPAPQPQYY